MSKPQVIVSADEIQAWDIVGINSIPARRASTIYVSSGTAIEDFKVSDTAPKMRALVIAVGRDARNKDALEGFVLLPIAPHAPDVFLENGKKNLMLSNKSKSNKAALEGMGLDPDFQWRINHTAFPLPVGSAFGRADGKVVRYGSAPPKLIEALSVHIPLLGNLIHTAGVLNAEELQKMSGNTRRTADARHQDRRDPNTREELWEAGVAASISQRQVDAGRTQRRAEKLQAAKVAKQEQRESASGRLALKHQFKLSAELNKDIPFETAFERGLLDKDNDQGIDENDAAILSIIGEDKDIGATTLRGLYDAFVDKHSKVLELLEDLAEGTQTDESRINKKAFLEAALGGAVVKFYQALTSKNPSEAQEIQDVSQPYQRKPVGP